MLDVPLPNSFDSQGISQAARHGPFASSVPPRFGIESPPSSFSNKGMLGHTALRDLHDSAFGDTANLDGVLHGLGSSPPTFEEPLSFAKRPLHSERFSRPPVMSASLDVRSSHFMIDTSGSDQSSDDGIGEELLPSSLHELLPQERLRRFSRQGNEDENNHSSYLSAQRRTISTGNTPQDSKVGSLSPHSASPSRYNSIWAARPVPKTDAESGGFPSAFGHVGSPLRPSSLRTTSLNLSASPNGSPYVGSPPRQASMSMLTQELQRSKLSDGSTKPIQPTSHPGLGRAFSNGPTSIMPGNGGSGSGGGNGTVRSGLGDRGFSSSSLGAQRIEEEQGLFSMEDEDANEEVVAMTNLHSGVNFGRGMPLKQSQSPVFDLMPGKSGATLGTIGGQRSGK